LLVVVFREAEARPELARLVDELSLNIIIIIIINKHTKREELEKQNFL
jgi:hypothetical protein